VLEGDPRKRFFLGRVLRLLAARQFPTTTGCGAANPSPIFRNRISSTTSSGHVPMHAHPVFADFPQHYGAVCAALTDKEAWREWGACSGHGRIWRHPGRKGGYRLSEAVLSHSQGESTYVIEGRPEDARTF